MKLIEVQAAKEFADTFLPDIFLQMAVHRVLDDVPVVDLVHCKECRHYNTGGCAAGFGWCEACFLVGVAVQRVGGKKP